MMSPMNLVALLSVVMVGEAAAQCTTGQLTSTGSTETGTVTFTGLNAGQSVTVGGLTLSCTTGNPNGPAVATFFANLVNGASGNAVPSGCAAPSSLSGWSSGARSGQRVTFASSTPNADVTDLPVSGTFTSVSRVQGSFSLSSLLSGSLVCGRPAAGYTGNAADRWQEQHRAGGQLWDYKLGPGHAVDPEKQMGTYGFTGTGTASRITHTYGSTAYSWGVFLQAAPNIYSFCNGTSEVVRARVVASGGVSGSGCGGSFP